MTVYDVDYKWVIYSQRCEKCDAKGAMTCYADEIDRVATIQSEVLCKRLGFKFPKVAGEARKSNPKTPHAKRFCDACMAGICPALSNKYERAHVPTPEEEQPPKKEEEDIPKRQRHPRHPRPDKYVREKLRAKKKAHKN